MELPPENPFSRIGTQRAVNTLESELEVLKIHRAITDGKENLNVDFKQIPYKKGNIEDFLSDVCAFANTEGGVLILGVRENKESPHTVLGIEAQTMDDAEQRMNSWAKAKIFPNERCIHIYRLSIDDKNIMIVSVKRSTIGPYYYEKDDGHVFKVRSENATRHARLEEIRRFVKHSPISKLQINASLLADEFRRQAHKYNPIYIEMYGDTSSLKDKEWPIKYPYKHQYLSFCLNTGMITEPEVVNTQGLDESHIHDEVVPMVGQDDIVNIGRVPAKTITYILYEHQDGSGINDFLELAEESSKLLRQTQLDILYQTPSLYGITYRNLCDWIHILIYSAYQNGTGRTSILRKGRSIDELFREMKKPNMRSLYKKQKLTLHGDARHLSARLLEQISTFS